MILKVEGGTGSVNWCLTQYTDDRSYYWVVGYFAISAYQQDGLLRCLSKQGQSFELPAWMMLA